MKDYLYIPGDKQRTAKSVFKDNEEILIQTFPAIYQAVCDACQSCIVEKLSKDNDLTQDRQELVAEDASQLYRMHGWVLFELSKKSKYPEVVNTFKLKDKTVLPDAIRFLDVGTKTGLTFPKSVFMPFMKTSDMIFRQATTNKQFEMYGKNIIKVVKTLMHNNVELEQEFYSSVASCSPQCEKDISDAIYNEWIEKLVNMKMKGRFMDAMERIDTDKSKKLTTKTQNLRDKLLTNHVKE